MHQLSSSPADGAEDHDGTSQVEHPSTATGTWGSETNIILIRVLLMMPMMS